MDNAGGTALAIVLVVLIVFVIIVLVRSVRIIPQARAGVVERLGKYQRTLNPGLTILIPFVDRLIGEQALVMEPVTSDSGLVKIGGDIWTARSAGGVLAAGQKVVVSAIDGATAVVSAPTGSAASPNTA